MNSKSFQWTLEVTNNQGNLHLEWNSTDAIRAMNGKVVVYNGDEFPQNPGENIKTWQWTNNTDLNGVWQTDLPFGPNWYCAIIGNPNNVFSDASEMYIVQVVTSEE